MRAAVRLLVLLSLFAATAGAAQAPLFDAQGYRIDRYRAPVTAAPDGVRRVDTAAVKRLIDGGAALVIDAMPATGVGYDPQTGAWRLSERHEHIPGSLWYPEIGRGVLDPRVDRWFDRLLAAARHGGRPMPIVFYCRADCWMSWNAAKRARERGYPEVLWFPEGIEGWAEAGLSLTPADPQPLSLKEDGPADERRRLAVEMRRAASRARR